MKLYAITVTEKCEDNNGKINFGGIRTVAIYTNLKDADIDIYNNLFDIWEMLYDYAFIEEITSDVIYPFNRIRKMYKFDQDLKAYFPMETPDFIKKCYSISGIG